MALDLDPGTAAVGNPRLVQTIVEEMAGGAIPFERFMELALYHREHGYYQRPGRIGPSGDFLTSPTVSPIFGWVVAAWCREVWLRIGEPDEFAILEVGAGEGALATTILDWAAGRDDGFGDVIRYVAVEPNTPGTDSRVEWRDRLPDEPVVGVVLANELFDALPVRLFEATERGPTEVLVRWNGEGFEEARGGISTIDEAPREGRFEVSSRAYGAMRALAGLVERGAMLVFDYGYEQEELWAPWRTTGTLLCFHRHTSHEDPYIHVGEQDITAHVNFSDLRVAAKDEGLLVDGPVSQTDFLLRLGIGGLVESVRSDLNEYFSRRRSVQTLTDAAGLGRIRVLGARRGLEVTLPGFEAE